MPTLTIKHTDFYYEQLGQAAGSAPSLLLISGLTTNTLSWAKLLPYLTPHFHITLMDNRGAGRSALGEGDYTTETLAQDTAELITQLQLKNLTVLGHSFGGAITQQLLIHHPSLVTRAILCNTRAQPRPVFKYHLEITNTLAAAGITRELLLENVATFLFSDHFFLDDKNLRTYIEERMQDPFPISPIAYLKQMNATTSHNTLADLNKILAPTLWVSGSEDIIAPARYTQQAAAQTKHSKVEIMEGSAHMPHYEYPEQLSQYILAFTDSIT